MRKSDLEVVCDAIGEVERAIGRAAPIVEGMFVRTKDGTEGMILAVELGEYHVARNGEALRTCGFVALLKTDDGKLTTVQLEGAALIPGNGR